MDDRTCEGLVPARALRHGAWWAAVAVLAVNDHWLKGAGWLPGAVTGKLSDVAGLFAAPVVLAALLRVRSRRGLVGAYAATGLVFASIKVSATASGWFVAALAAAGLGWKNWVDPTDLLALPALGVSLAVLGPAMAGGAARGWVERLAILAGLPVMLASGENIGGANSGNQAPGNGDEGVQLALGDIAVDPQGKFIVSQAKGQLRVATMTDRTFRLVEGVPSPRVLAFWPAARGSGFFVVATAGTGEEVISYDLSTRRVVWRRMLERSDRAVQVDDGGQRLVLWNTASVLGLDADSGQTVGEFTSASGLVADVDLSEGRVIVTAQGQRDASQLPTSEIHVLASADLGGSCAIKVPNCADELVLLDGGHRGLMAPTVCGRDPVSVIDLDGCAFDRNLPGFGPVALSSDQRTAVAFIDRDTEDPQAPPLPDDVKKSAVRFHLMFIDAASLSYGTVPVGDELPRYAVTPDGQMLLVDASDWFTGDERIKVRIVDVASRQVRPVTGPSLRLDHYVLLPDSSAAFAIDDRQLFRLDVREATSASVGLTFEPRRLNLTPGGEQLLIKDDEEVIHLYDTARSAEIGVFAVAPGAVTPVR